VSVRGISHVTFVVADLERTARLLREGLGAREVYDSADRGHSLSREKFFVLGDLWLVAMEGEPLPGRSYRHVAFAVDAADLPRYRQRLRALDVEILPGRARIEGEGESLYFHDYDNHLVELHAGTLDGRLAAYAAADAASTSADRD
jgi:catechol 2,3-dioxygenase-like lactoylglutathione lyase family enzyme